MRLFLPPIEIKDDEGFSANDIFGLKGFGEQVKGLFSNIEDPLVAVLDSTWGSGKTTFVKMLAGEMRRAGAPVIYFDAFANDFRADPFLAIAAQIVKMASDLEASNTEAPKAALSQFKTYAKSAAGVFLRGSLRGGVKIATAGIVDLADFGDVTEGFEHSISKEVNDVASKYIDGILDAAKSEEITLQSFRDALSKLARELATAAEPEAKPKPVLFIIDELDRCRPDFAISLMETVKHVFSVENVNFLFVADMNQMGASVKHIYGQGINSDAYLLKFFNLTLTIPSPKEKSKQKVWVQHLCRGIGGRKYESDLQHINYFLIFISERRDLSLRQIEKIYTLIALAKAAGVVNLDVAQAIVALLCVLRVDERALFAKAQQGGMKWEEIREYLGIVDGDLENRNIHYELLILKYLTSADSSSSEFNEVRQYIRIPPSERTGLIQHYAQSIISQVQISN